VAARTDMADKVMTVAALDVHRQFYLAFGDNVKMLVIFSLFVDISALFDSLPPAGGEYVPDILGGDVVQEDGRAQVHCQGFVVLHSVRCRWGNRPLNG
jgi:hypothetical protein